VNTWHRLLVLGLGFASGCDRAAEPPAVPVASSPRVEPKRAAPATWPLEVVDGLGRKVSVARPAVRIVSLAPSNTEILFAIGAGDRVVGRTTVDTYPPEALKLTSVGGMTPQGINLEAIVALRPDLVLATGGVQAPIVAPIERLGLPVVALDAEDFEGVARNIRLVGKLTDHSADADRLTTRFLDRVQAVRARVASRTGPRPRPRVLYLISEDPLVTAGPKTFIGQMIETAGGINIFGDVSKRYPKPSEEEILSRAPDVILTSFGAMNAEGRDESARRANLRSRPGWGAIPAVRDGRIALLEADRMSRPGPRLVEGLEAMADALETAPQAPKKTASGPG